MKNFIFIKVDNSYPLWYTDSRISYFGYFKIGRFFMKRQTKFVLILIMCIAMIQPAIAITPMAEDVGIGSYYSVKIPTGVSHISLPVISASCKGEANFAAEPVYYESIDDFVNELRSKVVAREGTIVLGYKCNAGLDESFYDEISDKLFAHTGNPKEGDYLWFTFEEYDVSSSGYISNGSYYYTFVYTVTYYSNAEQEAEVDRRVAEIVSDIKAKSKTEYETFKAIYDFICQNVEYDYTNLINPAHKLKYSAYAALVNKTAVCQGYANLFYRLALECGLDSRIVSGYSNLTAHAWNIVKIDGKYYNIDATWDSSRKQLGISYSYYLLGTDNFDNHISHDKYLTNEFTTAYPISKDDYKVPTANHVLSNSWFIDEYATPEHSGSKSHHCTICGEHFDITKVEYVHASDIYKNYVTKKWSSDGIDFVSSNGFMGDTGNGDFNQTGKMTRSMFVTVLYRMAGSPEPKGTTAFTDLNPKQKWYHKAVAWAYENGIVTGTSATTFAPDGEVTREQIATFLYRYVVEYLGTDVSDIHNDINVFPDSASVGKYAREALSWANAYGLIKGQSSGNTSILAPKNDATREEVAVVITRFCLHD